MLNKYTYIDGRNGIQNMRINKNIKIKKWYDYEND